MATQADKRLSTWAEIASYIGRDVRTARRYEVERGLPVRRLPGSRSTVFAFARDLDAWRGAPPEAAGAPPPPLEERTAADEAAPAPRVTAAPSWRKRGLAMGLGLLAAGAAALLLGRPPPARELTPEVRRLTAEGVYAWNQRTPAGIAAAIDRFTQAVVRDPGYAPAYAGLADAYDLAPEFTGMKPTDAFPRAQAAAERAIALDPSLAAAHRALAFESFWWGRDLARSAREFRTALALEPQSAVTHLWYANTLAAELDGRALEEIARAEQLDPASTAIRADKGWIQYMLDRPRDALATLAMVEAVAPAYAALYRYRELAERALKDDAGMLRDLRREGELTNDPTLVRLAEVGRAAAPGGHRAVFTALAVAGEQASADGRFPASRLSIYEMEAGRTDRARSMLRGARTDRQWYVSVAADPVFTPLRRELGVSGSRPADHVSSATGSSSEAA